MANETRLNIRLSEKENQRIKDFCDEKGIKSKSKVGKEALNFALNGKSDIDFGIKTDFASEPKKPIEVKDGLSNCPHCAGEIVLDPGQEKYEKKIILQNFIPAFRCINEECNELHENDNYSIRPVGICLKCNQFSNRRSGSCPWCNQIDGLIAITDTQLDHLDIPDI